MSISGIGARSALAMQSLLTMRQQLDDLQRQLGTGKKADTYAGVGIDRGLAVGVRAQLSALAGYSDTITNVDVRLNLQQTALTRIRTISHDAKSAAAQAAFNIDGSGQTTSQRAALAQLDEILGLLNTKSGDRYLFSGQTTDKPAVASLDHILDGDGVRAGLKQMIDERKQADLGASGLGRLVLSSPTPTSVSIAEDAAGSPFGFKLAAATTTMAGATVTGPTGTPPSVSVDLGATNPNPGEKVQLTLKLPDGSTEIVSLTATTNSPPGPNEFTIGADTTATAASLQSQMGALVGKTARTSLTAASALAASNDFFSADPPRRIAPPANAATAYVPGTPDDTIAWYTGEKGSGPARATATARIDQSISVSYGARANEEALRSIVQNVATLAAVTFSGSDPDAPAQSAALNQRLVPALAGETSQQKIETIQAELAGSQATIKAAKDRHTQTKSMLQDMEQRIEGAPKEEVAVKIMTLQTNLQASLQTTALLLQTSLVKFL